MATAMTEARRMQSTGLITYDLRDRVAWIGLNRPAKRNAINDALLRELETAVRRAQVEARALVVFGHGPCFSAGLDLAEHRARTPVEGFHNSSAWHAAFAAIRRGAVPAIAALHGATVGGGLELAAACHLRVADATAFFALPEGSRGIFVGGGASVHVARLIGAARMADMMLTGRVYQAEEGERAGFAQYLVPAGEATTKAIELAKRVAQNAPLTNYALMHALPRIAEQPADQGFLTEALMAAIAQSAPEAKQRVRDFLEGRAAKVGKQ
jgi:enoyl-CoA hydratase/carnithine racemase